MLKIYIGRHGQDKDNEEGILNGHRDRPLTHVGRSQARDLGKRISEMGLRFEALYMSPLQRVRQTASEMQHEAILPRFQICQELIERDFGVMTGRKVCDIEKLCAPDIVKGERITYFLNPEGAETFPQLIKRAKKFLERVIANHKKGNVLVLTSGDIGKMIYGAYYGIDWKECLTSFHFGNSELLLLSPDCDPKEACLVRTMQFNN